MKTDVGAVRRWRGVIAAFGVAALVLGACGGDDDGGGGDDQDGDAASDTSDDDGGEGGAEDTGVTLRVGVVTDSAPIFENLEEGFYEETGIAIEFSPSDVDTYQTTTRTELNSGTAPDVLMMWPGDGNPLAMNVVHEFLDDLSDEPWVDEVPEGFVPLTNYDGEQKAIALTTSFIGLVRNLDVFEEHGWDVPETWSELLAMCDTVTDAGLIPLSLGLQTPWQTQIPTYGIVPTTVYSSDPDWNQQRLDGEVSFVGSGWEDALEKYLELDERGCFNDDAVGLDYDGALQLIGTGEAAMMIQISSGLPQMAEYGQGAEFHMTPVPASDDPDAIWGASAAGAAYAVNRDTEHPEEARQLLRYMREQVDVVAATISAVPAFPTDGDVDAALADMMELLEAGRTAAYPDQQWPSPEVQQVHFAEIQRLFTGEATPAEALAAMDAAFDAALDD